VSTLHTVNKPSWNSDLLASCLRVASAADTLLLIEDGIYNVRTLAALAAALEIPVNQLQICVLRDDLLARGMAQSELPADITAVDQAGFVALVCRHQQSVHWF
jgi:sulfur relay protein TusB/DsrH